MNRTFNRIVLGHKTVVAAAALQLFHFTVTGVLASSPELCPFLGFWARDKLSERKHSEAFALNVGGLGVSCEFSRAGVNGIELKVRRQRDKALLFPTNYVLSTQRRLSTPLPNSIPISTTISPSLSPPLFSLYRSLSSVSLTSSLSLLSPLPFSLYLRLSSVSPSSPLSCLPLPPRRSQRMAVYTQSGSA